MYFRFLQSDSEYKIIFLFSPFLTGCVCEGVCMWRYAWKVCVWGM